MLLYTFFPRDTPQQQEMTPQTGSEGPTALTAWKPRTWAAGPEGRAGDGTSVKVVMNKAHFKVWRSKDGIWACTCGRGVCTCDSIETARRGAGENYKYKHSAGTGNLQPSSSRFHSSKCHLSNVLAYYDLSSVLSRWGIPCSLTARPPTHNWLGSRSISASRPSLMRLSLALLSSCSLFICLYFRLCSSASSSLSLLPVSVLSEDWLQAVLSGHSCKNQ